MKKTYIQPAVTEMNVALASATMLAASLTTGAPIVDGDEVFGDTKERDLEWEEF